MDSHAGESGRNMVARGRVGYDDDPSNNGPFFPIMVSTPPFNPANSTTYYFGTAQAAAGTVATGRFEVFPFPGQVIGVLLHAVIAGLGTGELFTAYLRINNTTDYLIGTFASNVSSVLMLSLAIAVSPVPVTDADFFEVKLVAPTTGTPATNLFLWGQLQMGPPPQ